MSATRRLAAILAVDVVGYSRLMGADEVGTAKAVREHREAAGPIVASYGGRIVKTMGDGLLLEFPSVVAAVEAAIAIQKLMRERNADMPDNKRVLYRIGVNLGDVLIDGDDILGDGVNIAARLEGICDPGGVFVSGSAFDHVRDKVDANFVDLGEKELKNIARAVRVYSLRADVPARSAPRRSAEPAASNRRPTRALRGAGLGILAIAIAAGAWYLWVANRPAPLASSAALPAGDAHLSIVVLPFKNLSGDPAQDYFADGITENLTTDLSRIRDSFVIASTTAFTFKGKTLDAKEIGKQLGVRYVLEGSAQRDQNRVRVNAQLIDAESGAHLWAERFEQNVADLFDLQDQVVARLANTLGNELFKAEAEKGARSKNPDAIDLTMRGRALVLQLKPTDTKDKIESARALYEQALEIDPNNAEALAGEAATYGAEAAFGLTNPGTDYEAKILGLSDRAIALAPDTMWAHSDKGNYLQGAGRWNEALRAFDAGLAVNPNSALLHGARGFTENSLGRFESAKSDEQQAMRLSPRDPLIGWWYLAMAAAELGLGQIHAAIEAYDKANDERCCGGSPHIGLAAAYAFDGRIDEAKSELAEARRLEPKLTFKSLVADLPNVPALIEGLRKAGLAEETLAPAHLSIVVLPFTNLSDDAAQDYFADGITENLTTELSRIRNSFVIARNTAFTFKGKNVDARQIGKELGVRYVLEGSAQREQSRVRVNAQLIDAESGAHLWADRFDEDIADLFKLQDQVVARLANSLGDELVKAEATKGARSKNPDAIDLTMRGLAMKRATREDEAAARALFDRALAIDSNEADAVEGEASSYLDDFNNQWTNSETDYQAKILGLADRAIALAPDSPAAYETKGYYLSMTHRWAEALRATDAGLAINPNSARLFAARGWPEVNLGRFEQAKSDVRQAMRLSPRDPDIGFWHLDLGSAELGLGHFDAAIEEFDKANDSGCCSSAPYISLAAAYALEGKMEEAKSALADARRSEPKLTIKWLLASLAPNLPPLYEGLRKAGLPEE